MPAADGSNARRLFQHDDLVADEFEGGRGCEPYQAAADDHREFRGQLLYSFASRTGCLSRRRDGQRV